MKARKIIGVVPAMFSVPLAVLGDIGVIRPFSGMVPIFTGLSLLIDGLVFSAQALPPRLKTTKKLSKRIKAFFQPLAFCPFCINIDAQPH